MDCPLKNADAAELIIEYSAGKLDSNTAGEFKHHLESCADCRALAAHQQAVWSALDELPPVAVSPDFDAKLYERITDEEQEAWWKRALHVEWSWRPALPIAAASAALFAAFLLKNPFQIPAPQSESQPKPQIEQVVHALDDMDMLKQVGVEVVPEKAGS
jgi:anti-sigma factor RsiW